MGRGRQAWTPDTRVLQHKMAAHCFPGVCVFTDVCAHLDELRHEQVNEQDEFRVWVTILGCMPHHVIFRQDC